MSEVRPTYDDEFDLFELFQTLWNGKWKIFLIVVLTFVIVFGIRLTQPPPSFIATTEIRPITSVEAERYAALNAFGSFKVTPLLLQNLYFEQLEERKFLKEAIHELALIEKVKVEDDKSYNKAIEKLSSRVKFLPPINVDGTRGGDVRRFWTIEVKYNNKKKWQKMLSSMNKNINQSVKHILQQRFETYLFIDKKKRNFELIDITTQIENTNKDFDKQMEEFELKQEFRLEDINTQISNALTDYERKTSDRLAFLYEQAEIARRLGVAKNTIEAQTFGAQTFSAQNEMVININSDTPFYLRGYEAIEKEIELIALREDIRAFIVGFFDLEQNKRTLEQDKTLQRVEKNKRFLEINLELEKKQRALKQDKILERAESLFASTPIVSQNDFLAVSARIEATEFKYQSKGNLYTALSILLGGIIGVMNVFISAVYNKRKKKFTEA